MAFCVNCGKRLNPGATICEACGTKITVVRPTPPEAPPAFKDEDLKTGVANPSLALGKEYETMANAGTPVTPIGAQSGRVLGGRYQLDQCIGAGGMGEIYRARRLHIGDTVAVKVLRNDVVENEKSRQRFYREARAAAMLHHPNAVVIHDFGEDTDGTTYIVMELLLGRSLRQLLIDEGSINAKRSYGIIRQACAALDAGHRNGIVHRDIKPDNIILLDSNDDVDHIKILDFGIAKLRDKAIDTASLEQRLTNMGTVIGTPHYMSPEQCQGEEADARSDIYSVGVVLYELLTGVAPFIAKTPTGIAIKHVTEPPRPLRELNPNITPAVERVVLRALEKAPAARPQTSLELARELEGALSDEPETARLYASGDQPGIDKSRFGDLQSTEILKTPERQDQASSQSLPQSYDTTISPPAGTDRFSPSETNQFSPQPTSERKVATRGSDEVETPVERVHLISQPGPEPKTDPLRPYLTPPTRELDSPKAKSKPKPEKVAAPSPAAKPLPIKPAQARSRTPLLALIGVLLLAVAGLAWWLIRGGNEQDSSSQVAPGISPTIETVSQPSPSPSSAYPGMSAPNGMVYVLGGVLRVGRDSGGEENERPAHVFTVKPFFIDRTEVTSGQYQKFIDETGYGPPPSWQGNRLPEGADQLPVTDVTWEDAMAYAKWAGKRLPTEEEWEFAARGTDERIYPWGNEWIDGAANLTVVENVKGEVSPVGQFPNGASPFGVLDLSGNVWEWTSNDYAEYPGGKITRPAGFSNLKVIRGGSYESTPNFATATLRRGWPATRKDWPKNTPINYSQTGFRCVQDVK